MTEKTMKDYQDAIWQAIKEACDYADLNGEHFCVAVDDITYKYMPNKTAVAHYYGFSTVEECENQGYMPEKAYWFGSNEGFWLSSSDEC